MINFIFLAIYLAVLIGIGVWSHLNSTPDTYLIADRKAGALRLGFSISAGFFDSFILVAYTGYVYVYGWPAVSLFMGTAIGFALFFAFARKIQSEGVANQYYGISDYFQHRYGRVSEIIVSSINIIFYVSLLLIQFIFGSTVLSEITGWHYNVSILLVGSTILLYVGLGGLRSVLNTDVFQWILIGVILLFLVPVLLRSEVHTLLKHADFQKGSGDALGFLIIGAMAVFASPELWQRCYAGRDLKSVRGGLLIAGLTFPVIGVLLAAIGFFAYSNYPGIDPQTALVQVFKGIFTGVFGGLGLVLLLSAIMSTADTCLFVIAPTVVLNIFNITDQNKRKIATTISVVVAAAIAVVIGMLTQDILSIALALASLSLAFFPILFIGLITKLSVRTVNLSLSLGIIAVLGLICFGEITPVTSVVSLPVVLISVVIGVVWNKLKRKKISKSSQRI